MRRISRLAALLLALAAPGLADSDGYFCVGDDYLAFEVRSFNTPDLPSPHRLRVVRYGLAIPDFVISEIEIPDFQAHSMDCGAAVLRIAGWDRRPIEIEVSITEPLAIIRQVSHDGGVPRGAKLRNLGAWLQPGVVPLPATSSRFLYRLVLERREEPVPGGIEHHTVARIEKVAPDGAVVASRILLEAMREETICDA